MSDDKNGKLSFPIDELGANHNMHTTLNKIRAYSPCQSGWEKLLKHLGKTKADDEPLQFLTILESNGLDDALWCLRSTPEYDRHSRLFAVWCARQAQHLLTDSDSFMALDYAEAHAYGFATDDELTAAYAAAYAAAGAAAWAAAAAAYAAAYAAASAAARGAAYAAAGAAAWAAAAPAADAARDAARDAQSKRFAKMCLAGGWVGPTQPEEA